MPLTISSFLRDETFVLLVKEVASELYLDDIEKKKKREKEKKRRIHGYARKGKKKELKRMRVCVREKEIDSRTSVRVTEYIRMIFTTR